MSNLRLIHVGIALTLVLGLVVLPQGVYAQEFDAARVQRATVYIIQALAQDDSFVMICTSSGTLVSRDGLILTSAHSTAQNRSCPGDLLLIALSLRDDEPPTPQYRASLVQADIGLDLALLRIDRELDGRTIRSGTLTLPFVEVGDSDAVRLDETLTIVGYPNIGNQSVTLVRGTVSGFVFEPRIAGSPSWLKTIVQIPGTMSGGGAYNSLGQLIGVPTTAPLSELVESANCVSIQDFNRDGVISGTDRCIPTGAFINTIRPSRLALSLIRAATLGLQVRVPLQFSETSVSGVPSVRRLFFAGAINESGMPVSVIQSLPSGSNSLFLVFDYANMTSETVYELRVTTNGISNPFFSIAPVRWSGGSSGLWYIGSTGQPWPNGVYEFTLFIDGVAPPGGFGRLVVGEPSPTAPTFSDIVFGLLDLRGNPLGNGFVLPTGTTASARFLHRNIAPETNWTAIWYLNGTEIQRIPGVWDAEPDGAATTSIETPAGLVPGSYRLELYIEAGLAATSDFTIAGGQQGALPQVFSNLRYTAADSAAEAITADATSTFTEQIDNLYALFDWQQFAPGTLWNVRWLVDGVPFFESNSPWQSDFSGANYLLQLTVPNGIPDGTYTLQLRVNNVLLASVDAQVGIGQLPIDLFARASGVSFRGRLLDSDTRTGIAGVTILIISEQFSVEDFVYDQNQLFDYAVSDSQGFFEIKRPLEFSTADREIFYSLLIAADGYLPLAADGIEVTSESPNPLEVTIYLNRD